MSILTGFKKYRNYRTDSNGDHQLQSFWTSSDTVEVDSSTNKTLTTKLTEIDNKFASLPKPMVFKGTLGAASDNPDITALPVDGSATIGDTYKVITEGTYASVDANVGDMFTCVTKTSSVNTWSHIPAGDETIVIANPSGEATDSLEKVSIDGTIYEIEDTSSQEIDTPNATPFLYRPTPYNADRVFVDDIVGASVGWNQLVQNSGSSLSVTVQNGHKYVMKKSGTWTVGASTGTAITGLTGGSDMITDLSILWGTSIADSVYNMGNANGVAFFRKYFTASYYPYNAGELLSVEVSGKKYVGFNQWDEIAEIGQYGTTNGAKVNTSTSNTTIRSANFISVLPNTEYYFYNTPNKGRRVFYYDENKEFITSVGTPTTFTTPYNCRYVTFHMQSGDSGYGTVYNHDICINISKTTGTPKNGDYVPYNAHTYTFPSQTLRGLFTLVDGELKASGDVYGDSGVIKRKFKRYNMGGIEWGFSSTDQVFWTLGIESTKNLIACGYVFKDIADVTNNATAAQYLGNLECTYRHGSTNDRVYFKNSAYTDKSSFVAAMNGVYMDIELPTPTTEQAEPYTSPQICDKDGTEEWLDNRTVPIPVGHDSRYADLPSMMDGEYIDYLVDKVENIDSDFEEIREGIKGSQSVTGNPITFTDGSESYASQLDVELKPIQDLHGYDRPWVGGAGKNKFPYASFNQSSEAHLPAVIKAGTYWISAKRSRDTSPAIGLNVRFWYDASNSIAVTGINATGKSVTLEQDVIDVSYSITNFQSGDYVYDIQLEVNSSATTYEPYSNICPISGISECSVVDVEFNQWDEHWENGTINSDGTLDNSTTTRIRSKNYIPILPNTVYYYLTATFNSGRVAYYDANKNFVSYSSSFNSQDQFRTPENAFYMKFSPSAGYGAYYNGDICINLTKPTGTPKNGDYLPYHSSSATITLGQTVYGGNVDFLTGVVTVDRGIYTIPTIDSYSTYGGHSYKQFLVSDMYSDGAGTTRDDLDCDRLHFVSSVGNYFGIYHANDKIVVTVTDGYSIANFNANIAGAMVVYPLATPTTLRLSPAELKLLQGNNTVTTNGYSISMKYQPTNVLGDVLESAEEYIDRKIYTKIYTKILMSQLVQVEPDGTRALLLWNSTVESNWIPISAYVQNYSSYPISYKCSVVSRNDTTHYSWLVLLHNFDGSQVTDLDDGGTIDIQVVYMSI